MKVKALLAATALAMCAATGSWAATIDATGVTLGDGEADTLQLANGQVSIDFTWRDIASDVDGDGVSGEYLAFVDFTAHNDFYLTFNDYRPESDQVGFLEEQSGFSLLQGGTPLIGSNSCGGIGAYGSTTCEYITGAGNTPPLWTVPPETYGLFAAGSYRLAFSEGDGPTSGSAEFLISEVPVPAAGFLLLGGLAGLAAIKRRKKS